MLVPKLTVCMIHLFHSNEVKFNFLKKLFVWLCFDLNPETECKLFADKLEMESKFQNGVILSKFDGKSSKVNPQQTFDVSWMSDRRQTPTS